MLHDQPARRMARAHNGARHDARLLRDARAVAGAKTDTDTVRLGLEALVRRAAYERLRALRGSEPSATDTPRRRGISQFVSDRPERPVGRPEPNPTCRLERDH